MITKASLEKALPHLLRPIIRLCVRYGVKIHQIEQEAKGLFVQEAKKVLEEEGQPESASKISVMTGLQRPVVTALVGAQPVSIQESLVTKVIGAWCSKKKYITVQGTPKVLSVDGKMSEFAQLVSSVSQALNPYTVLFELERAKLVRRRPRGLELLTNTFNSRKDVEQSIQYLASDINDMTASIEENINAEIDALNHHITTEYDNIPRSKAVQIRKLLLVEGDKLHRRMRQLLSTHDRDINDSNEESESVRIAFCSFSRCEVKN